MAGQKMQPRVTKFLQLLAQQLCKEKSWNAYPLGLSSNLDVALRKAITALPQGSLRSSLDSDLPAYIGYLEEELKKLDIILDLPIKDDQRVEDKVVISQLKVVQGPLLSSLAYSRAVEAAVSSAKGGVAKELVGEWREALVRLLQSRSNPPLALLWAFVAFERCKLTGDGESESSSLNGLNSQISVAQSLLHSLKFMTAGFCGGPTAVASAAPILPIIVHSITTFTGPGSENDAVLGSKKNVKFWKSLKKLVNELSGFVALCHHKGGPVMHGLCKSPNVSLGLDIWLPQNYGFLPLFPFATPSIVSRVDGMLNSAESVLHLGEIVETEVALLRLVVEIVNERLSSKQLNKKELEEKSKHNIIVHAKYLGSSGIILDMLLEAPLPHSGILSDEEEFVLRGALEEMAVLGVPNTGMFGEDGHTSSSSESVGKDCVLFLKRIIIARRLTEYFRSKNEYLRASELHSGMNARGAPSQLGDWLGDRGSLRLLITTAVLENPRALLDWLLNANDTDFGVVLEKAEIQPFNKDELGDSMVVDAALEEGQNPDEALFFIDTTRINDEDAAGNGFDADRAFTMAAGQMQGVEKEDVLFHRVEQLERKRAKAAAKTKMSKTKQRKTLNGEKANEEASVEDTMGEDEMLSESISTSEDESEEEASMSE